jgi:methylmalonyl-CoA mutase
MTDPSARLTLAAQFPEATPGAWKQLVLGVLRKSGVADEQAGPDDVERLLTTETYDGIRIRPLYTAASARATRIGVPGHAPFVRGRRPEGTNVDGWDVRALHTSPDPKVTAEAALTDLEGGVTSLWIRLGAGGLPVDGLADVLREVFLELAPIALDAGAATAEAAAALFAIAADRGVAPAALTGSLGADPLGLAARTGAAGPAADAAATAAVEAAVAAAAGLAVEVATSHPGLRTMVVDALPYHDAGGADAQELGLSLATGVAYLRALTGAGLELPAALRQLEFRYAATADQFATIAKLRAARLLWARVAEVCGAAPADRAQHQHVVTSSAMLTRRDPWVNLLRTTVACFGAGVGGADAVTVLPFDTRLGLPDDLARRLARNIQVLLQEESSLIRVIDPAGGSWYVESLTTELAEAAWAVFTEIERAGGLVAALGSGLVADRLDATWERRRDDLAHRRAPLTGVSEFPNVAETLPDRAAAPAPTAIPGVAAGAVAGAGGAGGAGGGLPVRHYDQDYELLRQRSDAHLAATGARPRIFLATLGSAAASTARGTFAANLFQAGGFETPNSGTGDDPAAIAAAFTASGARIACLCSSDKVYAASAAPVAAALRAAGAGRVWLAGKPGQRSASDAAAGVDGYVATGDDAVAILSTSLAEAGVA